MEQTDGIRLLRIIAASPRPTGSAAIENARRFCTTELQALGFVVREQAFDFSALPGSLATPLIGGAVAIIVGLAGRLGFHGSRAWPLAILAIGALALAPATRWLARRGVLDMPVSRRRGVNLEATQPGSSPKVWLCAHLDSKSQPVPTLARVSGLALTGIGGTTMLAAAVAAAVGVMPNPMIWAVAAVVTLVGAIPVVLSTVGTSSPGALDNASGVAAVISAARALRDRQNVGILLTDAEELGLAGARAWGRARDGKAATVLNCDGVDDVGSIVAMYSGPAPIAVLDAVARASRSTGIECRPRRLVPGILTDSVAFADTGMAAITMSRGTWRSLGRVHTLRDDAAHLAGTGIAETAALLVAAARELGEQS